MLELPNQTHDLKDMDRLIGGLSALYRYSARNQALPQPVWSFGSVAQGQLQLSVRANRAPVRVLAWTASSASRDFRASRWSSHACARASGGYLCSAPLAGDGYTGLYAELFFKDPHQPPFSFSTTVCLVKAGASGQPQC